MIDHYGHFINLYSPNSTVPETITGFLADKRRSAAFWSDSRPPADFSTKLGGGIVVCRSP